MNARGFRARKAWVMAVALLATWPAAANDSTASMGAGGLVYTTSSLIEIQRETLVIGEDEVHVSYDFLNTGTEDISTLVAFPLPEPLLRIATATGEAMQARGKGASSSCCRLWPACRRAAIPISRVRWPER